MLDCVALVVACFDWRGTEEERMRMCWLEWIADETPTRRNFLEYGRIVNIAVVGLLMLQLQRIMRVISRNVDPRSPEIYNYTRREGVFGKYKEMSGVYEKWVYKKTKRGKQRFGIGRRTEGL